jgi:hypothetical protein
MKMHVYEVLYSMNQGFEQALQGLKDLAKYALIRKDSLRSIAVGIQEVRAGANADFIEELGELERNDQGRFWKERRAFEKKLEDPDDIYITIQRREEQRKKMGLSPRIVVLPWSRESDEKILRKIRRSGSKRPEFGKRRKSMSAKKLSAESALRYATPHRHPKVKTNPMTIHR